jgi:hypothetical protein
MMNLQCQYGIFNDSFQAAVVRQKLALTACPRLFKLAGFFI